MGFSDLVDAATDAAVAKFFPGVSAYQGRAKAASEHRNQTPEQRLRTAAQHFFNASMDADPKYQDFFRQRAVIAMASIVAWDLYQCHNQNRTECAYYYVQVYDANHSTDAETAAKAIQSSPLGELGAAQVELATQIAQQTVFNAAQAANVGIETALDIELNEFMREPFTQYALQHLQEGMTYEHP